MKIILEDQEVEILQSDEVLYGELIINEKKTDFKYSNNSVLENKDFKLVNDFIVSFYSKHNLILTKSNKALNLLAREIGWWSENDIAIGLFTLLEINIIGSSWITAMPFNYELIFEFHGTEENYWLDTYGSWTTTFEGDVIVGVKRDQV